MPARDCSRTITGDGRLQAGEMKVDVPLGRLNVVYPPGLELSFTVHTGPVVLGREPGGAIPPLDDATVSRRHLAIELDPVTHGRTVRDLGSRNGSWLDGRRLVGRDPTPLPSGASLRVGHVILVYEAASVGSSLPWVEPTLEAGPAGSVSHEAIPGQSVAAHRLRGAVARAAPDISPVLIVGQTGTGKELIAAEIHRLSARPGAMVALNCAALSSQLIESQLFGHMRGAFTGADEAQPGLVRAAARGTLFLDEIGEMPLPLQAKLLRLIQEREIQPVGSSRAMKVDVRIVAATNRDLTSATEAGTFRRDLYARLALLTVPVPALRERRPDILAWVTRLHRRWLARRGGPPAPSFTLELDPPAAEALLLNAWPENLRGVDRLVHQLGPERGLVGVEQLPAWLTPPSPADPGASCTPSTPPRSSPSREELEAALHNCGSIRATARYFNRDRRQIYRWMDTYGIDKSARDD